MTVLTDAPDLNVLQPRPHQQEALDWLAAAFAAADRAQLLMACGSGKTFVGAWHADRAGARLVVVLAPSLTLVAQTSRAWLQVHPDAQLLIACSDPSTAAGAAERAAGDPFPARPGSTSNFAAATGSTVTTDAHVIARHLDVAAPDRMTLIVGTYHSAPAIAAALTLTDTGPSIDLLVCDEAHQLTGRVSDAFGVALRDGRMPARQRLFMTATPVHLGNLADDDVLDDLEQMDDRRLLSMDDASVFGAVAYRLSAGEAIERGLLADYRVLVVAGDPDEPPTDAALRAFLDACHRHHIRRVLTFHNRVAGAKAFAARLQQLEQVDGVPVHAEAVDGSMPARQIRSALAKLGERQARGRITVVASAQVLREGVDVPAVDAVMFADPRTSNVDIVQAVGRALRLHPGKRRGTIIVPLPVRPDEDDDDQLAASRYGHVWRVLRGLRAHDDRIAAQLDEATRRWNGSTNTVTAPDWLEVVGADQAVLEQVVTRIVRGSSAVWEHWFGLLEREAARVGSAARVTTAAVVGGRKLGVWLGGQRHLHSRGLLHADKARRFEQLPGWSWSSAAAADQRTLDTLAALADRLGTVAENTSGGSVYEGLRDGLRRPLGLWLARTRRAYRDGTLDRLLAEQLEQLPGWTWEPLSHADRAGVEALREFAAWEKHVDIPAGHVEGSVELGAWVLRIRRLNLIQQLNPAVRDEVVAVSPANQKGATLWQWDVADTNWLLHADALTAYIARTGAAMPMPSGHVELVAGHPVNLYQWTATMRHRYGKSDLPADRAAWLQQQPGWVWRAPGVTKPAGEPIDLGGHPHGTAKGAQAKCPCLPCKEYSRRFGRQNARRHRDRPDGVPASAVAPHLHRVREKLQQQTAGDKRFERQPGADAIAIAADVPVGDVRDMLAGRPLLLTRADADALLNLTAQDVLDLFDAPGTRGRLVMSCQQPIDAGPTLALLADLTSRGWNARWIARELGYRQVAVKVGDNGRPVSRRVAEKVAALHRRVGDRVAPSVAKSVRLPTLADIEAIEAAS